MDAVFVYNCRHTLINLVCASEHYQLNVAFTPWNTCWVFIMGTSRRPTRIWVEVCALWVDVRLSTSPVIVTVFQSSLVTWPQDVVPVLEISSDVCRILAKTVIMIIAGIIDGVNRRLPSNGIKLQWSIQFITHLQKWNDYGLLAARRWWILNDCTLWGLQGPPVKLLHQINRILYLLLL